MGYAMAQQDTRRSVKSETAFRTISEVADELDVPQHVLRFWETKFTQIRPMKRGGGRRYYRPEDVTLLRRIRTLLYEDGFTIKGVQKLLREGSVPADRPEDRSPEEAQAPHGDTISTEAAASAPGTLTTADAVQTDIFTAIEQKIAAEGLKGNQRQEISAVIAELTEVRDLLQALAA